MVKRSRKRTRGRPGHRLAIFGALSVVTLGALGVAAAAQLDVDSTDLSEYWDFPCSYDTLSIRVQPQGWGANRTAVRITNVPEECFGETFEVGVSNSSGTLLASGSATCTTVGCTVSTGNYRAPSVTDVHALVSTWGIPANWTTTCTLYWIFWYCD